MAMNDCWWWLDVYFRDLDRSRPESNRKWDDPLPGCLMFLAILGFTVVLTIAGLIALGFWLGRHLT